MNANQARPLMAFWALAVAAAVITGLGLRAQTRDVTVAGGVPAPVRTDGASELVLGGVLRGQPAGVLANPLSPDLWSPLVAPTGAPSVQVAAPATSKIRTHGKPRAEQAATPTQTSTATKTAVNGHGKPRKDPPGHSKDTATATATAQPTGPGHGKGSGNAGNGNGR